VPDRLGGFEIDEQLQSYRQFYLDDFVCKSRQAVEIASGISPFKTDVAAFDVTELRHATQKFIHKSGRTR
jgi:hypothetical protein